MLGGRIIMTSEHLSQFPRPIMGVQNTSDFAPRVLGRFEAVGVIVADTVAQGVVS